ncbi:hypothetical protein TNIN_228751 [Trichonephila inaurata madagascariensis]|uniref:C2H2-type domain-containing protein n=1 Tax=Trichonephila inaurata madagascariensis TaxID=2747483 RepID=A0A8X6XN21_9ARAC|nr:hypothetical protein TNIN_228751 [Trichonephila inaurata madagascariensis]
MTDAHSGDDPKYVCDMCNRTFQFRRHYLKHTQVHKDIIFMKCFKCAAAYNSFIQFFDHLRTHEQDTTLKCAYCSESLSSPDARRLHENNHFIENRFICEVCNRKFDTEMSLEQQLPLHGPEKPIDSEVCTGEFTQKKAEETTVHDHDREKFRCLVCGKIFGSKYKLKEHEETHGNENSHSCPNFNCFENGTHLRVLDYSYNRGGISLVICVLVEKHLNRNVQVSATEYSAICVTRLTIPSSIKC